MPFDTGLPLTTVAPDPIFDMTVQGQREASFVFSLMDEDGYSQGVVTPIRESVPTLAHDTTRVVKRTVTLLLGTEDAARFDPIKSRVEISMKLSDGRLFPLGRYMPVSSSKLQTSSGDVLSVALVDEMFIIAQPLAKSFSCATATRGTALYENVQEATNRFLDNYPTFSGRTDTRGPSSGSSTVMAFAVHNAILRDVEPSSLVSAGSWQLGTDGGQVLNNLSVDGDYFSPWIDNNRVFRMIRTFDPETVVPQFNLDTTKTVVRNSITRTNDFLNAPNRIIVVSNAAAGDSRTRPIIGTYDIPSSAPHSIENRGFVIAKVLNLQVTTAAQAAVAARNIALRQQVVERVELSTPPDPRHDSYDVVEFDGVLWLEIGWSMALIEGGTTRRVLQRIFQ